MDVAHQGLKGVVVGVDKTGGNDFPRGVDHTGGNGTSVQGGTDRQDAVILQQKIRISVAAALGIHGKDPVGVFDQRARHSGTSSQKLTD